MKKVLIAIGCLLALSILGLIIYTIIDFRNDYICSTTTDMNYFVEHNCIRYYERGGYNE